METPLIFDIKRSSTVDGPGIRTTVFLKGCNLDCFWCHNPEGKSATAELALFSEKCVACGACLAACKNGLLTCETCGACVETCPEQARKLYGKQISVQSLMDVIKADAEFFRATGGGVTVSGGECLLYPEFVAELAMECKKEGIPVAVDTAGSVPFSHFERVLPYVDLFLYDIKCLDPDLHKRGTGKDNLLILENLERLKKTDKQILIRIPVIPNFNEGEEVERIKAFCKDRNLAFETLAYHAFGEDKKRALSAKRTK